MRSQDEQLAELMDTVLASAKYKEISPDLVRRIGWREIARRTNLKEAVKNTKSKLHQVGGAYFVSSKEYAGWLNDLKQLVSDAQQSELLAYLATIMRHHASTRERLPILDQFYQSLLADLPPIHSVLDLACGLNPLALPWMHLAEPVEYYACDIYQDMISFLREWLALLNIAGQVQVCDLVQTCPTQHVDLALLLKALPCLEQIDKTAGFRLLQNIRAKYIIVSFPIQSLGGKGKGMEANYEAHFRTLSADTGWSIKRFEFATELAFLITKQDQS